MSNLTTAEGRREHFADSYHPLLMPDADSFADVLEYLGEWQNPPKHEPDPEPRYIPAETPEATAWERQAWTRHPDGRNRIGPYCTVDLAQLGGAAHRSMAVRATDAVLEAVAGRIVTPDDDLSFSIVAHETTGRALVVLSHGYIIGSHWLAYINPATIPPAERSTA